MGACGSKPQNIAVWESYFSRSTLDSLKLQFDQCVETGSGALLDDSRRQCERLQEEFNTRNAPLARNVFRLYDHDKDGLLDLQQFERLIQESLTALQQYCKENAKESCLKAGSAIFDQLSRRASAQKMHLGAEVQEQIQRRLNVVTLEIDKCQDAQLLTINNNIHQYSVALLSRLGVESRHVGIEEFVSGFFTAYSSVMDPQLGCLHVHDPVNNANLYGSSAPIKRTNTQNNTLDSGLHDICVNIDSSDEEDSDEDGFAIPKTPVVTRSLRQVDNKTDIDLIALPAPELEADLVLDHNRPPRRSLSRSNSNNSRTNSHSTGRKKKVVTTPTMTSTHSNNNTIKA